MRTRICALVPLVLAFGAAHAQTFYGPGGLIINPTAYTDHAGYLEFNSSFFNRQADGTTTSVYPSSITYAPTGHLEVGALFIGQKLGSQDLSEGGIYLKQGLLDEKGYQPALALVGTSITGDGTFSSLTLVGSKELSPGYHVHLGTRYVNYSFDDRADGNLIAGVDARLAEHFKLLAEADTRLRLYHFGSEAFGIQYSGPVVITLGLVDQAANHFNFFVGVGYPIGNT